MASGYEAGSFSVAFVTVPNKDTGKALAKDLLEKKLAACVNIIPEVKSIYQWEGKVQENSELILMIKTKTEKINDVSQYVRENHPYDGPEVISSKIDNGNPAYLEWVANTVDGK